uniref:Vesicle-associated membrane protein-associated protein A n=1 Tax=Aegilops tauschii TaxID=37682 RepID=N1QY14_AEGTA
MVGGALISVYPDDLTFLFELDKPCYCNLKVVNNSEHHVAFKVKTTSPRKYFVRPNASVVQPWDSCTITITLQSQKEYPPDMQSKDKFLIQSTRVAASTDMDEIPPDTFNKEADKVIEEMKLKVVYTLPSGSSDDSGVTSSANRSFKQGGDDLSMLKNASIEESCKYYFSLRFLNAEANTRYLFLYKIMKRANMGNRTMFKHHQIIVEISVKLVEREKRYLYFQAGVIIEVGRDAQKPIQTIQRLKDERDNNLQQNQQMQRELVLYIDLFTLHVVSTHCFSSVQLLVCLSILTFGF